MRTLAIRNGDLVLAGSRYGMVSGIARVQQQIGLALREPNGNDRFHTDWGSTLPNYIGTVLDETTPQQIRNEVLRVVRDFIVHQNARVKDRATAGLSAVVSPDEMIVDVTAVRIEQQTDRLLVKVTLRTASNQEFSILTSPGSSA